MYQNTINFERIRERQQTEDYIPKGRKLNKTKRGGGVKGAFRNAEGKDALWSTKRNTS
ncbi:hypothetical protein LS2_12 [Escherichia virus LS2]|uniref:Uncharacterized protein n=1 Tax=Escherichia virus LS2 TaxID=2743776 RepID=A0ACD4QLH3_9CAUD